MGIMPDNKNGKKAFKYSGLLRSFFAWPLYIGAILIIICTVMFCINVMAANPANYKDMTEYSLYESVLHRV